LIVVLPNGTFSVLPEGTDTVFPPDDTETGVLPEGTLTVDDPPETAGRFVATTPTPGDIGNPLGPAAARPIPREAPGPNPGDTNE
jgi:hypothetical protein